MKRLPGLFAVLAVMLSLVAAAQELGAPKWLAVKTGKDSGISGMVLIESGVAKSSFLVAHDNKKPEQTRFAVVTVSGSMAAANDRNVSYLPLAWPTNVPPPVDLEALTPVPGQADTFLALASAGDVCEVRLVLKERRVEQVSAFRLPDINPGDNYEGLALCAVGGKLLAAWGHRGEGESPGVLHWGMVELPAGKFTAMSATNIVVPWPEGANLRHISDIVVEPDGTVYVSSASDAGDDGPFNGAIYMIGAFVSAPNAPVTFLKLDKPVEVGRGAGYKIEGIARVPGKPRAFAAGSDDENKGSFLGIVE